ncbi:hypothetical protein [Bradyrhizobium sp. CCGUVB14]|uniref:hypothetical protein n=1 Tax=Bradyrhizobium sp. CCGUVB14 TaxID=2949628 RepID=UPI0020B2D401|nr:hypothetical protein [Bradyrhizobium sp. CCGUVB14]MCP3444204.1 hypothetical protein [Bradyrhizobium sp. CCGUVB14]
MAARPCDDRVAVTHPPIPVCIEIPGAIVERFTLGAEGAPVPVTEGATRPVALVQRHAGIVQARRYSFALS